MVTITRTLRAVSRTVVTAAAILFAAGAGAADLANGRFPPLGAAKMVGGTVPDTEGKVVLVDFWASWCAPCRLSFPAYSRLQDRFRARGLVVVAVSVDTSRAAFDGFVARMHPSFVTLLDSGHDLVARVAPATMPTSYLIDRSGRIRYVHAGFHGDATEEALAREVAGLIGERIAP